MHNKLTLILAIILCTLSIHAQHTEVEDIRAQAWPIDDPYASLTEVPKKWEDASAVILYQSYQRTYTKKGKTIRNANSLRKRLKIQDNSALEEYSEFAFGAIDNDRGSFKKKSDFIVGEIKIIKADGASFLINLDEAVDDGDWGKKVALSNLEVGDIIDYYYYQHDAFYDVHGHTFSPVISTLGEEYPIMHQDFGFKISNKFYVAFNTYNGAPEVKTIDNPIDETVTFMIEDHDREAEEYLQWFHPNRELPIIKFQVIQANHTEELKGLKVFTKYMGSKLKQKATEGDIIDLAKRSFTIKKLKDKGLDEYVAQHCNNCPTDKKIKLAYNYLRFHRFVDIYEKFSYIEAGMDLYVYGYGDSVLNDVQFVNVMAGYLLKEGIDFEVLATVPKRYGTIDDVLLADEISYIVNAKDNGESIYLSKFSANTSFNHIPYELQGQNAYVLQYGTGGFHIESFHERYTLPEGAPNANMTHGISHVSWSDDDQEKVHINRRSIMTGHNKDFDRADLVTLYDIIDEEQKHFNLKDPATRLISKKSKVNDFNESLFANRTKLEKNKIDLFEASTAAEYEFELEDYQNPALINTGRWEGPFEYTDEFTTSALIKKAGKNYIFEIGKLLGKQMAIEEDQVDRKHDIYMAFARSFKEEIIVDIPDGYTVEGLDRLNINVENSTGMFVSSAEIKNSKLHMQTLKQYNHSIEPVKNWPAMLEFLEAAYDLSQEKILLKKKSNTASASLDR